MPSPLRNRLLTGFRIPYLFRDDFTTPQATPLVTRVCDVIGNWLFTDTNSKISVANNLLNFATGAAANDGGWGNIRTRQAGRIFIARIIPSETTNGIPVFGWDSNTSGTINDYLAFRSGGELRISPNNSSTILVGVYTATTYWLAAIMRAIGFEWFIRGGAFTYWTKLLLTAAGTASGYPAINAGNTTAVFTAGNARVSDILWLPVPIASDGFSAASITDGLGHPEGVTGGLGAGGGGKTWTGATWTVSGGTAYNTPTLGSEQSSGTLTIGKWYSITATQANYFFTGCAIGNTFRATAATALDANNKVKEITLSTLFNHLQTGTANVIVRLKSVAFTAGTQVEVAARLATDKTSGIILGWDGQGNVKCAEFTGSTTWSSLMSVVKEWATNDSVELHLNTTAYRCYHITAAGVITLLGSGTCTVDGSLGTDVGAFSTDSGNTIDNFRCDAKGNENQYGNLDQLIV